MSRFEEPAYGPRARSGPVQPPMPEVKDNLQLYGLIQHINKGCNSIKCSAQNHQPAKDDLLALITKLLVEARIDELQRVLIMASTPKTRTSASIRRVIKSWLEYQSQELSNLNQETKDIDWDRQIELERQINPKTDTESKPGGE